MHAKPTAPLFRIGFDTLACALLRVLDANGLRPKTLQVHTEVKY